MTKVLIVDDEQLIRQRICSLLEEAGYNIIEAVDGQQGLQRLHEHDPELVLVDFVMPKMNGYQFCAAMRSNSDYSETAIILLSVRSNQIGERFINRFDVDDIISKPFDDEALLALVEKVITERKNHPVRQSRPGQVLELANRATDRVADPILRVSESITSLLLKGIPELASLADDIENSLVEGFANGHGNDLNELKNALEAVPGEAAFWGSIAYFPLSDILQLLAMQNRTGVLRVSSDQSDVSVQLRKGCIEMVVGKGIPDEFLFGRYLVQEEMISRQDLDQLLSSRKGSRLLGDQLVKLGYLTKEDLARILRRQTTGILIEVLGWTEGSFSFYPDEELEGLSVTGNRIEIAGLVMDGLRQVDEWRVIERKIPDLDVVFEPLEARGSFFIPADLSYEESFVLGYVDGKSTVREIIQAVDMGSFKTCKILYRLLSIKLIERSSS
jgi:CheY-like chemotaxis protein